MLTLSASGSAVRGVGLAPELATLHRLRLAPEPLRVEENTMLAPSGEKAGF
ncbi:MAG: hypothetical protein MUE60_15860 [Candidatus Eisenbacteria bacterium]|nr:hypothetical protein [Candidatus Eisenbacteria bacterium]